MLGRDWRVDDVAGGGYRITHLPSCHFMTVSSWDKINDAKFAIMRGKERQWLS